VSPGLPLDVATLGAATVLVNGLGAALLFLLHPRGSTLDGAGIWSLGLGFVVLGNVLTALRGTIPLALSVVVANSALVFGFGALWLGCARFLGRPERWGTVGLLVAATAATLTPLTYVWPTVSGRIMVVSATLALLSFAAARLLLVGRSALKERAIIVGGTVFALNGIFMAARIPGELFLAPTQRLLESWSGLVVYGWWLVFSVALLAALLLMISERLNEDLETLAEAIPICANCKKMRDEAGSWDRLESFLRRHHQLVMTHGICPDCEHELYADYVD
jgi:hypothetical protein